MISVVVVLHRSAPDLGRLLASLEAFGEPDVQLICVDTGADDGGGELARAAGAEVIVRAENPGFGAANNAGVTAASGDVTLLLNPDITVLGAGDLGRLAARARERDALHVPRLRNADGSVQRSAHPVPGTRRALLPALVHPAELPRSLRLDADPWRAEAPREVGWAVAAAVAARTATLRALGPFDPGVFLFYEDLDLCLRARQAGVPTLLHPDIALRHAGAHSTAAVYGGEPHELLARRRRAVIGERLGAKALARDDRAQRVTFTTRLAAKSLLHRDTSRERAQLAALRAAKP